MRRAAQATRFYPGDLAAQVEEFLAGWRIPDDIPERLVGGVVPHAGWTFSGRTAARTFHTLVVRARPRTFVLLGSVHVPGVAAPALFPSGAWETPAGTVEVDEALAAELLEGLASDCVAAPEAHDGDHALEVQMPFIRLLAPGARVVPIAFPPLAEAAAVGARLGKLLAGRDDVVVVASTDLTHYGAPYEFAPAGTGARAHRWLRQNDARMIRCIRDLDAAAVMPEALAHQNACGPGALAATLRAAAARGSAGGSVIEYTDSHLRSGEREFEIAVGYVGAVV